MSAPAVPYARDDPPWSFAGWRGDPDFGRVFAWNAARGAVELTFDRRGRHHALTLFDPAELAPELVIHGRRFSVALGDGGRTI